MRHPSLANNKENDMAIKTIKATIQMRRGLEQDFDADQMTAGEWAVSTDTKYIRMCFAPGIIVRMATYEAFEQDMHEIQTILATCQDIQVAVDAMEKLAEQHSKDALDYSGLSKSYAVGTDGEIREDDNTDNAKYYYQQSKRIYDDFESSGSVTGVKGDAEERYRTGNVNITPENIGLGKTELIDMIYPIGSIYISVNAMNPSSIFGGTWEQLKDRFLLASGDVYSAGSIGGESTHKLTENELPSHRHSIPELNGETSETGDHNHIGAAMDWHTTAYAQGAEGNLGTGSNGRTSTAGNHKHTIKTISSNTGYLGSGIAHNNMPPYLAVNMWKRIS